VTGELTGIQWALVVIALLVVLVVVWIARKGRGFARGDVFRASRLSSGNRLFPTQVLITPTSVVQYTPRWIGRREETIHMAHVSSVNIDTGLLFSNVIIETSGGSHPIRCHGHRKGDAVKMKDLIERYQTDYYRSMPAGPPGPPGPSGSRQTPPGPDPVGRTPTGR
jgi:hypothetical protein